MAFSASSAAFPPAAPTACIRCSERKVRCDKRTPCKACIRHNVHCVFPPPRESRRKRNIADVNEANDKLKFYETLLRERGILDPEHGTTIRDATQRHQHIRTEDSQTGQQQPTPTSAEYEPRATMFNPQLLLDRKGTSLVDNLWSRVAEEMHDDEDALDEDSGQDASDTRPANDHFSYIIGHDILTSTLSHPDTRIIRQLWQTFVENVNPLTKLVHVPSLQPAIEKRINNIGKAPSGFGALMFAIYSMAVLSLTDVECKNIFGEARATLLSRYVGATKAALSRANFMSSTSIVVLQALYLHILSIRDTEDARAVWTLTGLAIRVAEGMGMRLDGTLLGLSPFMTEIRRRIWWQLVGHDFRAAELCGQAKIRAFDFDETAPKLPANLNDAELDPTMPQAPVESAKPTEMLWIMMKSELVRFASAQKARMQLGKVGFTSEEYIAMDDLDKKTRAVKELEDIMETKYIRFCDPTQPLQLWTLVGARMSLNLARFIGHHPRRWAQIDKVPDTEQELVWEIAVQLLEQYSLMQSSPQLQRFAWHIPYFIQWHAVIHVLDVLRTNPAHIDADKAWHLVDALYENNAAMLLGTNKPIFVAVGALCLKAFESRIAARGRELARVTDPPQYILKLQKQRQAAKQRRETMSASRRGGEPIEKETRSLTPNTDATMLELDPSAADNRTSLPSQQILESTSIVDPRVSESTSVEDDNLWYDDALNSDFSVGGPLETVNVGIDAILAQDDWPDATNDEGIDWAQWDAWLGSFDATRTYVDVGLR